MEQWVEKIGKKRASLDSECTHQKKYNSKRIIVLKFSRDSNEHEPDLPSFLSFITGILPWFYSVKWYLDTFVDYTKANCENFFYDEIIQWYIEFNDGFEEFIMARL